MRTARMATRWSSTCCFSVLFFLLAAGVHPGTCFSAILEVGPGKAFSTIQGAVDAAQPGDTVLVSSGTYAERVVTRRDGQKNAGIEIKANGDALLEGGFNIEHRYITVEGFEIAISGQTVFQLSENADSCSILNNDIHDIGEGVAVYMPRSEGTPAHPEGCLVKGNWIHGQQNANMYILLGGRGHVVEDNEFGPGEIREDAIRPFGDDHVIRNNFFHDIQSGGGHTDVFQVFYNNGWRVLNLVFEKNTILNWEGQAWMADCTPDGGGITIRNNIYANIRGAGISYCPRTKVYNNVFHETGYGNVGKAILIRSSPTRGSGAHSEIKNNIFFETGGEAGGWYSVEPDAQATFEGDYNLVYPFRSGFQEDHGINGEDPRFKDPSNGDFHLRSGSPAIDSGTTLAGFSDDIEGNARSGNWDIGPYEYNGQKTSAPKVPKNLRITGWEP